MKHISEVLNGFFVTDDRVTLGELDETSERRTQPGSQGILTGFSDLDAVTAGFQRSDLIVIAGVPGIGKTSFLLGAVYGASIVHRRKVGIFALEMPAERVVQRLLSMETGVDSERLRTGRIGDAEWDRMSRAFGRLNEAPIYIDDTASASIMDIRSKAVQLQIQQGLDMIVVDYLQLIDTQKLPRRSLEISGISRGLKRIARELDVPVVAISQLRRDVEQRASPMPVLRDLDGSLDEDSDIVLFIYREDRYETDSEKKGVAEIIVAKHRNGPVGSIILRFFDRTARFANLSRARVVA